MPEFSLIIPVYNVQDFLAECLDSCINQTFRDIEIICINDCSPDDSYKILEEYAKKDSRIKIITHTQNRKQAGARNTGVAAAAGNYCWFIDSDDSIVPNACEIVHEVIKKTQADIVRFNAIKYNYNIDTGEKKEYLSEICTWPYDILITKKNYSKLKNVELQVWMYITRSSLLKRIQFRENVVYEDTDFTPILFSEANSIYCVNYAFYYYRMHARSLTNGGIGTLDQRGTIDSLSAVNILCDYVISSNFPSTHFCTRSLTVLHSYVKNEYKKFPEIHTDELDKIIKKADKIKRCFEGNAELYNSILYTYGNSRLLEFILRVYRFIIKRIPIYGKSNTSF